MRLCGCDVCRAYAAECPVCFGNSRRVVTVSLDRLQFVSEYRSLEGRVENKASPEIIVNSCFKDSVTMHKGGAFNPGPPLLIFAYFFFSFVFSVFSVGKCDRCSAFGSVWSKFACGCYGLLQWFTLISPCVTFAFFFFGSPSEREPRADTSMDSKCRKS